MKIRVILRYAIFPLICALANLPAFATRYFDDFSNSQTNWTPVQGGWRFINPATNAYFYRCDCPTNSTTWNANTPVSSTWQFQADMYFRTLYGNSNTTGVGTLGLSKPTGTFSSKLAVNVTDDSSGNVLIQGQYNDGTFHTVIDSGWLPSGAAAYHVCIARPSSNYFQVIVLAPNGFYFNATSPPVPIPALDQVTVPGFRVNSAMVDFANLQIDTPATNLLLNDVQLPTITNTNQHYLAMATTAANDLLSHWWLGTATMGQIASTWNGFTTNLPDARGGLWERGMMYFALYHLWRTTDDPVLQQVLASDWRRTESVFTTNELQACGPGANNYAVDDAGWSSVLYLDAYDVTGDPTALLCAQGIVRNACGRWSDLQFGGGLWYSDAKQIKSLYQVAIALSALRIYQITGESIFYSGALLSYNWMETHLLRSDNLYWVDYNSSGPAGTGRFNQIAETNSVVSLGGAFAMGVFHARLYQMTGDTNYLARAIRTANAIYNSKLFTTNGIYLDDRDAWTQGTFAGDWAREVLPLTGVEAKHWTALWATANSICINARTNGFYGGSWAGPAEGPGSPWWANGSVPEQITTSSSSANMIMAAAALEKEYSNHVLPHLQILSSSGTNLAVATSGQPYWQYQLQTSTNLTSWTSVTNFYPDPDSRFFNFNLSASNSLMYFRASPIIQP